MQDGRRACARVSRLRMCACAQQAIVARNARHIVMHGKSVYAVDASDSTASGVEILCSV